MTLATRNKHYMQLCWVVPDLESTIGHWVRTAGAGPFFVFGDLHFDDGRYRGAPADVQRPAARRSASTATCRSNSSSRSPTSRGCGPT